MKKDNLKYYYFWDGKEVCTNHSVFKSRQTIKKPTLLANIIKDLKISEEKLINVDVKNRGFTFHSTNNKRIGIYISKLANSGDNDSESKYKIKRIQVDYFWTKNFLVDCDEVYSVSYINLSENKILYLLTSNIFNFMESYRDNKKDKAIGSFSAFWLLNYKDYLHTANACFNNDVYNTIIIGNIKKPEDKKFFATNSYSSLIDTLKIISPNTHNDFLSGSINNIEVVPHKIKKFSIELDVVVETIKKLKRDDFLIDTFKESISNCENCETNWTFAQHKNDKQYFEVHHFIPYNKLVQVKFEYSLDCEPNLVSLCPTCHRTIHLGTDEIRKKIIKKIWSIKNSNKDFMLYFGTKIDVIDVIDVINNYYVQTFNLKEKKEEWYE